MQKTILILGATGLFGEPVARYLKEDGFQVRILARNVEKTQSIFDDSFEIIAGDATNPADVEKALQDCHGVHCSLGGDAELPGTQIAAKFAAKLGLKRISYISGATVCEGNRRFHLVDTKLEAEAAIRVSGVPYTIFCPTWPMEQLTRFLAAPKVTMIGKQPYPIHWFAADDLGRMVSRAYQLDEAANKRLYVHGPEAIAMKAALERACATLKPEGESVAVMPVWLARVIGTLTRNQMLKFAANLMGYFDRVGELGDPSEANQLLGAPTITLDEWLQKSRDTGITPVGYW